MKSTLVLLLAMASLRPALADEGMWTYNGLPTQQLKERYGFEAKPEWINHVMRSSLRISAGGSGSFVSKDGLILTNHHVAADALHNVSTPAHDYIKNGFYADTLAEEIPVPATYVDQLESIADVTARVTGAVLPSMNEEQAHAAKQAESERIRQECKNATKLECEVVMLYQGGSFHLYRYKRYTDIRIAFAPELSIAFFGGDPDNFEFPRYDLDMTLLRAYENGKPAQVSDHLRWSANGAREGELVFVSGNPGSTQRSLTTESLKTEKNVTLPLILRYLQYSEKALLAFSAQSEESRRRAESDLFGVQNSRKVFLKQSQDLNEGVVAQKQKAENELLRRLNATPELKYLAAAWDKIAQIEKTQREILVAHTLLETGRGFFTKLFRFGRTLVRLPSEAAKPSEDRLPEYADSQRQQLESRLLSKAPVFPELEEAKLAASLALLQDVMGNAPIVQKVLLGKSPDARARELIRGSQLSDPQVREEIYRSGAAGLQKYKDDAMLKLLAEIDPEARAVRKQMEERVLTPLEKLYANVAKARFEVFGDSVYPDATFTPRLTFGAVKGYEEKKGGKTTWIAPFTTLGGAYEHEKAHGAVDPFRLPDTWHRAFERLELSTELNFVSTCDIIGGNSGSPVFNAQGELVGLIFDGNIHSIMGDFYFDESLNRATSVDSRGMLHALDRVYGAQRLHSEILGK